MLDLTPSLPLSLTAAMRSTRPAFATPKAWCALGLAARADTGGEHIAQHASELRLGLERVGRTVPNRWTHQNDVEAFELASAGYCEPVLVEGASAAWRAATWTLDHLVGVLGDRPAICGLTTGGDEVRVPFADFATYARVQAHDGPLYVFDDDWSGAADALLDDYEPPVWAEDLLEHAPEALRPPSRWLLVGPERSGSGVHVDPLGTSAWNALLSGQKLWVLWEPSERTARLLEEIVAGPFADVPSVGFARVLEAVEAGACPPPRVVVQQPGETLFVPASWLHGVLNLELTIAVTENFVPRARLAHAFAETLVGAPRLAQSWKLRLQAAGIE